MFFPKQPRFFYLALFFIVVISIVFRIYLIYLRSYPAGDEIWAYYLIQRDFRSIWLSAFSDLHGPFYFSFLHFLALFLGELSVNQIRYISLFFNLASTGVIYVICRTYFNNKIAKICLLVALTLPAMIWPAIYARYYAFLIFLFACCLYFFLKFIKAGKLIYLILLFVLFFIGIYTHYYFLLGLLAFGFFVLQKDYRYLLKKFFVLCFFLFIVSLPGLYSFLMLAKPDISGRHLNSLLKLPSLIVTNLSSWEVLLYLYSNESMILSGLYLLGFSTLFVYIFYRGILSLQNPVRNLLILCCFIPPVVATVFAYLFQPLLSLASLQIFLPAFIFVVSCGISVVFNRNRLIIFLFGIYICIGIFLLTVSSKSYNRIQNDFAPLLSVYREGDVVLHSHIYSFIISKYYLENLGNYGVSEAFSSTPYTEKVFDYHVANMEEIMANYDRVWFFYPPWDKRSDVVFVKDKLDSNFAPFKMDKYSHNKFQETDFDLYLYVKPKQSL